MRVIPSTWEFFYFFVQTEITPKRILHARRLQKTMSWEDRPPFWEIKIGRFNCPYKQIRSKIDKWAIRCDHPGNKNRKCLESNCPIKYKKT